MIKIITIIGARPQIIKSSAISRAIKFNFSSYLEEVIVHTGQHYDNNMSDIFFKELGLDLPKYNLNIGSSSHGVQTAKMIEGLEEIFLKELPQAIIVYGDTNSTIAGALAASKLHIPIIHIEAGLRSFNKLMPEEVNRIACDHMSTLLFTPTKTGLNNLKNEGFDINQPSRVDINQPGVFHCGDIMFDNSLYFSTISDNKSRIHELIGIDKNEYILATIHRDTNTDKKENLEAIFRALVDITSIDKQSIVFPIHPRTRKMMKELLTEELLTSIESNEKIFLIDPVGFLDIIALEKYSSLIITDSGGIQKEAFFFEKPCVIVRNQTEWVEIVENGNAVLVDAKQDMIVNAISSFNKKSNLTYPDFFGNGDASEFICKKIIEFI